MAGNALFDILLAPALWLGLAIALICGGLFYGWRGGTLGQLARDLLAAVVGFAVGQALGMALRLDVLRLGELELLAGLFGAFAALFLSRMLVRPLKKNK